MPYNPTATYVATVRIIANGEEGEADVFNRPTEDLDSRTAYLKAHMDTAEGTLGFQASAISDLQGDISALNDALANLDSDSIAWPGSATIPNAASLTAAVELAATLGGGGGGGALTIRFGATAPGGTTIVHNLGDANHAVDVNLATISTLTSQEAAAVGDLYVVRGVNEDVVYNTGSATGVLFDYVAAPYAASGVVLAGTAVFAGVGSSTEIVHNLGNSTHAVALSICSASAITEEDAASIGAYHVIKGANSDFVYNSGLNNSTPFTYIIS